MRFFIFCPDDDFDPFKAASATASAQPHTSDRDQTTSQHKMTKSSTSASIMEISSGRTIVTPAVIVMLYLAHFKACSNSKVAFK